MSVFINHRWVVVLMFIAMAESLSAADVDWRYVQQELKAQDIYFGPVDGQPGRETRAAVRRFQIKAGLPVTGEMDDATLASLRAGAKRELDTWYEPVVAARAMGDKPLTLDELFAGTRLAEASASRKRAGLREVQRALSGARFYEGGIDGGPGPMTHEALLEFQAARGLPQSAAADSETLAALGLNEETLGARAERSTRRTTGRRDSRDDNMLRRTHRSIERTFRKLF